MILEFQLKIFYDFWSENFFVLKKLKLNRPSEKIDKISHKITTIPLIINEKIKFTLSKLFTKYPIDPEMMHAININVRVFINEKSISFRLASIFMFKVDDVIDIRAYPKISV